MLKLKSKVDVLNFHATLTMFVFMFLDEFQYTFLRKGEAKPYVGMLCTNGHSYHIY